MASTVLGGELGPPIHRGQGGPGGWWIIFEPELHLGEEILVPDLADWRRERMPELPESAYSTLAPVWACEVLAPSTRKLDLQATHPRPGSSRSGDFPVRIRRGRERPTPGRSVILANLLRGHTMMEDAGTLNSVRDVLLRQPDIELACIFGSFAEGRQTPASDIDVAIAAREPIDSQRRLALNDAIANAAGRPVDLVDLQRAGPLVLTQALTRGKRIVTRDSGVLARLLVKMWYLNADLMPLVRMIQDTRRKRFLHGQ